MWGEDESDVRGAVANGSDVEDGLEEEHENEIFAWKSSPAKTEGLSGLTVMRNFGRLSAVTVDPKGEANEGRKDMGWRKEGEGKGGGGAFGFFV